MPYFLINAVIIVIMPRDVLDHMGCFFICNPPGTVLVSAFLNYFKSFLIFFFLAIVSRHQLYSISTSSLLCPGNIDTLSVRPSLFTLFKISISPHTADPPSLLYIPLCFLSSNMLIFFP